MNYLNDIAYVNKETLYKTINNIKHNKQVPLVSLVYALSAIGLLFIMSFLLSGPIGIFGGIIMTIVESALISSYLYVLNNVIAYNRFRWKDIKYGITYYIWKVYGVIFAFYIGSMLINLLSNIFGPLFYSFYWIIPIAVFILFNPLPEGIYLKDRDTLGTLSYCLEFMKENWLNWLLSNSMFFLLAYISLSGMMSLAASAAIGMRPTDILLLLLLFFITGIIVSIGMLFRGNLFVLLSTSTIRKRQFMRKL